MITKAINLVEMFASMGSAWSPLVVAELNGQQVKLLKLEEDQCPWHSHENEDEMFLILEGVIDVHLRDAVIRVGPGEFHIVRKGVEHRVVPRGKALEIIFQPIGSQAKLSEATTPRKATRSA